MKAGQTNPNRSGGRGGVLIVLVRCLVACLVTGLLVFFLIASRWLEGDVEVLQLRTLEGTDPVSVPAPPPPPALTQKTPPPPPPPQPVELPRLDLSINEEAPPIQAEAIESALGPDVSKRRGHRQRRLGVTVAGCHLLGNDIQWEARSNRDRWSAWSRGHALLRWGSRTTLEAMAADSFIE